MLVTSWVLVLQKLIVALWSRWFNPRWRDMWFIVDELVLEQGFPLRFVGSLFQHCLILICHHSLRCLTALTGQHVASSCGATLSARYRGMELVFNAENVNLRGYKWNETVSNTICYVSNEIGNSNYRHISSQRKFKTLSRQHGTTEESENIWTLCFLCG
jgi:hypothetical protein